MICCNSTCISQALRDCWGVPAALIVVVFGILLTLALHPVVASSVSLGPSIPKLVFPTRKQWATGGCRGHCLAHSAVMSSQDRQDWICSPRLCLPCCQVMTSCRHSLYFTPHNREQAAAALR